MESILFIAIALVVGVILGWVINSTRNRMIGVKNKELSTYIRGLDYLSQNKYDLAISELRKATELNSDNLDAYLKLGNIYRERGAVDTAVRIHESVIVRPDITADKIKEAQISLGLDYMAAKNNSRAIASFKNVISQNRGEKESSHLVLSCLRQLYEENGDWEEAYKIEEQILKLEKSGDKSVLAHIQTEIGKTHLGKDNRQAQRHFKNALRLDDKCVDAYISMGDLFYQNRELEKASNQWERIIDINPKLLFMINDRLEKVYYQMGHYDNLISIYRRVIDNNPDHGDAHIFLGDIFHKKGMIEETIREYKNALGDNPRSSRARGHIGNIYSEQNMVGEAFEEYQEVLKLFFEEEEHYHCNQCGAIVGEFHWKCPICKNWDVLEQVEYMKGVGLDD